MSRRGPRAIKVTVGDRCVYFLAGPWKRGFALHFEGSVHVRCPGCRQLLLQNHARVADDLLSAACTCGERFAIERTQLTPEQVTDHQVRAARWKAACSAVSACCSRAAASHLFDRMSDAIMYNLMGGYETEVDAAIAAVNAALA